MAMTDTELLTIYGQERLDALCDLTPKSKAIVNLLANGCNREEIALHLASTSGSIANDKMRILRRIGVADDLQAGLLLVRTGLFHEQGLATNLPSNFENTLTSYHHRILVSMTAGMGRTYGEVASDLTIMPKTIVQTLSNLLSGLSSRTNLGVISGVGYEIAVNQQRSLTMDLVYLIATGLTDQEMARKLNIPSTQLKILLDEVYNLVDLAYTDESQAKLVAATRKLFPPEVEEIRVRYGL